MGRGIGAYADADEVMKENQPAGGLLLFTWRECSFFRVHSLIARR